MGAGPWLNTYDAPYHKSQFEPMFETENGHSEVCEDKKLCGDKERELRYKGFMMEIDAPTPIQALIKGNLP